MRLIACGLFAIAFANATFAQDAHLLQQRASFAYREMQQAGRDAEQAATEAKEHEARAAEARKRWQGATDALEKMQERPAGKP